MRVAVLGLTHDHIWSNLRNSSTLPGPRSSRQPSRTRSCATTKASRGLKNRHSLTTTPGKRSSRAKVARERPKAGRREDLRESKLRSATLVGHGHAIEAHASDFVNARRGPVHSRIAIRERQEVGGQSARAASVKLSVRSRCLLSDHNVLRGPPALPLLDGGKDSGKKHKDRRRVFVASSPCPISIRSFVGPPKSPTRG
jgi:hypothetical protein